jgi:hypothetical protein
MANKEDTRRSVTPLSPPKLVPAVNGLQAWREEISVWMRLNHPNVVQCLGATANPPQIVMDWMPNGEVMKCMRKNPEADRLHLVSPLLLAAKKAAR